MRLEKKANSNGKGVCQDFFILQGSSPRHGDIRRQYCILTREDPDCFFMTLLFLVSLSQAMFFFFFSFKGRNLMHSLMKPLGLLSFFFNYIRVGWRGWGKVHVDFLSTILFSVNFLNHDGSCPDDKISYAGRMVFYTHASQNLARGLISQGFSESVGWEAARRVCILTCSSAAGDASDADPWAMLDPWSYIITIYIQHSIYKHLPELCLT